MINRREMIGSLAMAPLGVKTSDKKQALLIIFYVDVGELSPNKAEEYVAKVKDELKNLCERFTVVFVPQRAYYTSVEVFQLDESVSISEVEIDDEWIEEALKRQWITTVASKEVFKQEEQLVYRNVYAYFGATEKNKRVYDFNIDHALKIAYKYNIAYTDLANFVIELIESKRAIM